MSLDPGHWEVFAATSDRVYVPEGSKKFPRFRGAFAGYGFSVLDVRFVSKACRGCVESRDL